jgi:hypothetical protein
MTYSGTLIEDLMATDGALDSRALVSRALVTEPLLVEPMLVESWFASVQQSTEYDSQLLGVA